MNACTNSDRRARLGWLAAILALGLAGALAGCQYTAGTHDATNHDAKAEHELRFDEPLAAARSRYEQRLSADGSVPPNALMRAKAQRDHLLENPLDGAGISPQDWESMGPGNIGGRIRGVVIHPTDPQQIWIGSVSGGIWKTNNGGAAWAPQDDFMASLAVGCMMMDPTDPDVIYAGTGEGFFDTEGGSSNTAAVRGAGIFKTDDGGQTWNQLDSTANEDFYWVNRIAIDPNNTDIVFAATGTGVFRSIDGGSTWTQTRTGRTLDLRIDPNNPSHLVCSGDHHESGPWYSIDGGMSWTASTGIGTVDRVELAYAPSAPNTVYGAVSNNGRIGIWRSTDGGVSFTLRTSGAGISTYSAYNNTIWVDPTNADNVLLGGVYLFFSSNGGVNLFGRFNGVHADQHNIVNDPGFDGVNNKRVYFACDGGLYRTDDVYGSNVVNLNTNLAITQFYGAAISDQSGVIVGGTQDNGTLRFAGNPNGWTSMNGGDGGYCASDPTNSNYFYGESQRAYLVRSTNGGQSASGISSGIGERGSTTYCNFIPFLTLDPNNENRMLVCCAQLWRSDNVKASTPTWTSIKPRLTLGPDGGRSIRADHFAENNPINISTVAVQPGNSDVIVAGHNNGQVWVTSNGTDATPDWTRIDEVGSTPLPDRWVSTIVFRGDRVYVALMGWESDNLWRIDPPFNQWVPVTGNSEWPLPAAPISAMNVHPTQPGWLYVGTDIGVFTSTDDGQTWSAVTDGPGTVPVEQLIWRNGNELMAVTHGRGIFLAEVRLDISLENPVPGIAGQNNSFTVTNATSGRNVYYLYSFRSGQTNYAPCGVVFDMGSPALAGQAIADGNGIAVLNMFVPPGAQGRTVRIQAFDRSTCRVSNLVTYQFQ